VSASVIRSSGKSSHVRGDAERKSTENVGGRATGRCGAHLFHSLA
jgi:hypothetical protein